MKKIAAVFAALVIAVCSAATVRAVPTDESSMPVSQTSDISDTPQVSDNSDVGQTSSAEEITYQKYTVEDKNFEISLPSSMYVLTRDMDENDPALTACKTTKEEINKSFAETDTYIRARSKDFSYDITVDIVSNENTQGIDNLSALTEAELESLKSSILEQGVFSACTRTVYGKHLFLDLTFTQQLSDTQVYGMQEYTIVDGEKYTITFQSYNTPIDEEHKALMKTIMESLTISSSSTAYEEEKIVETPSDTETTAHLFNSKKFLVIAGLSIIGIAIFTALIVLTIKAKHNRAEEEEDTDLLSNVEPVKPDRPQEQKTTAISEPGSEVSTDDAQKILADIQSKAKVIASDIMEGNTQKRLQPVTPEKSTETDEKVEKSEKTEPFPKSIPQKTPNIDLTKTEEIKTIEEKKTIQSVGEKQVTETPVSEYERRFGKARTQTETIAKPHSVVSQVQHIDKENDTITQSASETKPESKKQEQIDEIKGFFRTASTVKGSETSQPSVKEVTEKQSSVPTASQQEKGIEPVKANTVKVAEPTKPVAEQKPVETAKAAEPTKPVAEQKPVETAKVAEPTKPVAEKKPVETAKATEPTKPVAKQKPVETVKAAEPTKPVAEKKPVETAKAAEPTKPVAEQKPVETAKATEPTKPVAEKKPVETAKAAEPTKPVAEKKPVETAKATEPTKPVAEQKPVETAKATEPTKPVAEQKPVETAKAAEPTKPVAEKKPVETAKATEPTKPVAEQKPVETAKATEPTKPVAKQKPVETAKVAEPTKPVAEKKPVETTKAAEPTKPVAEKKPVETAKATEPTKPVAEQKPVETAKATEPTKPVAEQKPVETPKAAEPTKPVAEQKPVETAKATEPTKPVAEQKPVETAKAAEPTKPVAEQKPIETEKVAEPTKPVAEQKPVETAKAAEPTKPVAEKKLVETAKVAEPNKPVTEQKPVETAKATEPTKPVAEKKPFETEKVAEPTKPVIEQKPVETAKAAEPTKPVAEQKPVETAKVAEPTKPVAEQKPVETVKAAEPIKPVAEQKPVETAKAAEPTKPVEADEQTIKSEGENMYENEGMSEYEKRFGKNRTTQSHVTPIVPPEIPKVQMTEQITEKPSVQPIEEENAAEQEFFDGVIYHTEPEQPLDEHTRFEKSTGICFEESISVSDESIKQVMPAHVIPRLESVKAEEYNRQMEQNQKTKNIASSSPKETQPAEPKTYAPQPTPYDDTTIYSHTGGNVSGENQNEGGGFIQNLKKKILK